jgi:transcriptional antiterminator NusG
MSELVNEKMKWYTIRTMNNSEKKVLERLLLDCESSNINIGRTLIPTEKFLSVKNGKKVIRERNLYPGYLFVETDSVGEITLLLKNIKGASGFIRSKNGDPTSLRKNDVDKLLNETLELEQVTLKIGFNIGDEVIINDGPFSKFKGILDDIDINKEKVVVVVKIFGRETKLDLSLSQIEKSN